MASTKQSQSGTIQMSNAGRWSADRGQGGGKESQPIEDDIDGISDGSGEGSMRVVFLTHYFPPEGNAPASRVYEICKRWVAAGHRVTVVTGAPNNPTGVVYPGYKNKLYQRETIDGIDVVRVWTYIAANRGRIRRSLNFLTYMLSAILAGLCLKRPDVYIATSPQFFCGIAGAVLKVLKARPFILEIRDIWPESIAAVGAMKTRWILRILEWMERWMYRRATRIVTVGDGYKVQLVARGVPAEKIGIVTNGVDTDLFRPLEPSAEIRRRHGLDKQFICAYVGTIGMASGLDIVLRAADQIKRAGRKDVVFMLVGDGAVLPELRNEAHDMGLDNVIFTGRLGKKEVPLYLATVDACLIHLRKKDLFRYVLPSKIFEAGGMGRPIIMGVEGCAADLVRQMGGGLLIEPENDKQLIDAVQKLAGDPELCRELGRKGHDFVIQNFNRDKLSNDYLAIVGEVVGQGKRAG